MCRVVLLVVVNNGGNNSSWWWIIINSTECPNPFLNGQNTILQISLLRGFEECAQHLHRKANPLWNGPEVVCGPTVINVKYF